MGTALSNVPYPRDAEGAGPRRFKPIRPRLFVIDRLAPVHFPRFYMFGDRPLHHRREDAPGA
jgi:hypothetical protein